MSKTPERNVDDLEEDISMSEADTEVETPVPEPPAGDDSDDDLFSDADKKEKSGSTTDKGKTSGNDVNIILKGDDKKESDSDSDTPDPFFGGANRRKVSPAIRAAMQPLVAQYQVVLETQLGFTEGEDVFVIDSPDVDYTVAKILHREGMKDVGYPSGYLIACKRTDDSSIKWVDSNKCLPIPK